MKLYQGYFFVLKGLILLQVVLTAANFRVNESMFFLFVDTLFKTTLGLFLGFFFWPYPPKGMDFEDGVIVSVGGFLILTQIEFGPIMALYNARDVVIKQAVTAAIKNE
jgi:hypothetical protein